MATKVCRRVRTLAKASVTPFCNNYRCTSITGFVLGAIFLASALLFVRFTAARRCSFLLAIRDRRASILGRPARRWRLELLPTRNRHSHSRHWKQHTQRRDVGDTGGRRRARRRGLSLSSLERGARGERSGRAHRLRVRPCDLRATGLRRRFSGRRGAR